jgi:phage baseplate assembly protein W
MTRLSLPLRLQGGRFVAVGQDSPQALAESVALLLDTRPGERRSVPEYGLPDPLFGGVDPITLRGAVEVWEPDATPSAIRVALSGVTQNVTVELDPSDEDFA